MTTPKIGKWSPEAMQTAQQHHHYIKVGDKAGNLLLNGAPKRWLTKGHESDVYISGLRMTGSREAVTGAMTQAGYPADQVQAWLASAYTRENYNTSLKAQFEAEVTQAKSESKTKKTSSGAVARSGVQLSQLGSNPSRTQCSWCQCCHLTCSC